MAGIFGLLLSGAVTVVDQFFEYTTLLLPGNGTNGAQNNTFLDGSTNNFTITRNGNTTQGTFSPFSQTGWGNYFDGNGDYLTAPNNAAFGFGASDFTIEAWIFPTAFSGFNSVFCVNVSGGLFFGALNGTTSFGLRAAGVSDILTATSPSLNTWTHVAVTRSGVNVYLFYNGVQQATTTSSYSFAQSSIGIGSDGGNSSLFTGYISNLRVIKGQALYTSAFTPSTTPLTTTSQGATAGNVSILTCQSNRFIDNSSNNFTITKNGDTKVVAFSPFNPSASWSAATYGGSGYFDGSGDYLSVANNAALNLGSSNYTIECWFYAPSAPTANDGIFTKGNTTSVGSEAWSLEFINSSGNIGFAVGAYNSMSAYLLSSSTAATLNAWNHIAVVRNGTAHTMYLNGASVATATASYTVTSAGSLYLGTGWYSPSTRDFIGYISNARLVIGTAVYTGAFTPPTAPLTAITNTSLLLNFTNAGIYDATSKNDLETVGNAQISTTQSKWGGSSIAFDGTSDYLVFPSSNLFTLGDSSANFTIETWIYSTGTPGTDAVIAGTWQNGTSAYANRWLLSLRTSGTAIYWWDSTGSPGITYTGISTGQWVYIAVVRSGGTITLYVNGVSRGTQTTNQAYTTQDVLRVGGGISGTSDFPGYIQDLRITKGYARTITASPTAAFPTL